MGEILYCIVHETKVFVSEGWHEVTVQTSHDECPEINGCTGPFTTCPPPELEEDWQEHLAGPQTRRIYLVNDDSIFDFPELQ